MKAEYCLVFLSDVAFNVFAETPISSDLKAELLKSALPQGSKWKRYAGVRSLAFTALKSLPQMYALSYSVATNSIVTPVVSFIIILDRYEAEKIISHQISGIENAFIRRMDIFTSLDVNNVDFLRESLIHNKGIEKPVVNSKPKKIYDGKQTVFASIYNSQNQWNIVETRVLEDSVKYLSSFRTFALQKEQNFQVLGLVIDSEHLQKEQLSNSKFKVVIVIATLIIVLIIAVVLLFWILSLQQVQK